MGPKQSRETKTDVAGGVDAPRKAPATVERVITFLHSPAARPTLAIAVCLIVAGLFFAFHHTTPKPKTYARSVGTSTNSGGSQPGSSALWNSSVHGFVAVDNGNLELLSPSTANVLASTSLPSTTATMTDNGNGKQFTFSTADAGPKGFNFNSTYQYIPIQFTQAADGSQDVGYYNLANGNITDISNNKTGSGFGAEPPVDSNPVFSSTNPDLLYFCRNDASCTGTAGLTGGDNYSYNIQTGQILQATVPTPPACQSPLVSYGSSLCELPGQGPTAGMGIMADTTLNEALLAIDNPAGNFATNPGNQVDVQYSSNGQDSDIQCSPLQWLDSSHILCKVDQTNIFGFDDEIVDLGAMTQSTNEYGNTQYTVPQPVDLLPNNDRSNSYPVYSADGNTIAFVSNLENTTDLYTVPITGGQPTDIGSISESTQLLAWR